MWTGHKKDRDLEKIHRLQAVGKGMIGKKLMEVDRKGNSSGLRKLGN
jgi:hypothetical protein